MLLPSVRPFWAGSRGTLRLAIPLMAAQVSVVGLGLVDTIAFGWVSTEVLAGGGLAVAVFAFIHIVCVGVVMAVGNQVAFSVGAGDRDGVRNAVLSGVWVSLFLGIFAAVITVTVIPIVLLALGQTDRLITLAHAYLIAAVSGLVPSLLFTTFRGLTVGVARAGPITVITVLALLVKAILSFLVVRYTVSDRPHVDGEASLSLLGATSAATYIAMAVLLWLYCRRALAKYLPPFGRLSLRSPVLRETLSLGAPIGATYGVEAALFTGVALIVGTFGAVPLAAHHVANQFVYLTFMLAVGLSHAASVQVGHAGGRGNAREARRFAHQALVIGLGVMTLPMLSFALFGDRLAASIINSTEPSSNVVVMLAGKMLLVAAFFQYLDGTQNIAMGALRGLKDAKSTLYAGSIGYIGVGLPSAYLLSIVLNLGPIGAWWGLALGLFAASAVLLWRLEYRTRMMQLTQDATLVVR